MKKTNVEQAVEKENNVLEKSTSRHLQVIFSQDVMGTMSKELAMSFNRRSQLELKLKEVTTQIKGEIAKADADISRLATDVERGYTYRDVDCTLIYDFTSNLYSMVRNDTKEVVESRPLSDDEKQLELPVENTGDNNVE